MDPLITVVGMVINFFSVSIAGVIVYLTARDKLRFDAELINMRNRIAYLESKIQILEGMEKPVDIPK